MAFVLAAMLATSAAAGAAPTASQVADINPAGDSFPRSLVNLGGTLLLGADDGTHGVELWRSKGTEAGTTLVKDINPGPADSKPGTGAENVRQIAKVGSTLFFSADDGTHGYELWRSNGTAGGTTLVKDIYPGVRGSTPRSRTRLTVLAHHLFFAATDPDHGRELWTSDGSSPGTNLVADINPGTPGSFPAGPTVVDGNLFFQARDPTDGAELWRATP